MENYAKRRPSTNEVYAKVLYETVTGKIVVVRDFITKERMGKQYAIDMRHPVVTIPERNLGYKFMPAEAAWILSGDNRVDTMRPFSKNIWKFSDDDIFFFGAYGPQIRDQMPHVIKTLLNDTYSRQAVISIWRKSPPSSKDIPCTLSLQWIIRDNKLHCFATMRSSDAWLGVPYDWFNFSMVSGYLALLLQRKGLMVSLGTLWFNAHSQHLYDCNWKEAEHIGRHFPTGPVIDFPEFDLAEYSSADDLVASLVATSKGDFVYASDFMRGFKDVQK